MNPSREWPCLKAHFCPGDLLLGTVQVASEPAGERDVSMRVRQQLKRNLAFLGCAKSRAGARSLLGEPVAPSPFRRCFSSGGER